MCIIFNGSVCLSLNLSISQFPETEAIPTTYFPTQNYQPSENQHFQSSENLNPQQSYNQNFTESYNQPLTEGYNQQLTESYNQPLLEGYNQVPTNQFEQLQIEPKQNQSSLQSVFSSFSSYLFKDSKNSTDSNQTQNIQTDFQATLNTFPPPPNNFELSVNNFQPEINQYQTENNLQPPQAEQPPPVPLYSPNDQNLSNFCPPPRTQGTTNTFRRAGLKRPAYAPIPGLTNLPQINPQLPPQPENFQANNVPQIPPLQTSQYFQPELSGYPNPEVPQPLTPKQENSPFLTPIQQESSPFLASVPPSEVPFFQPETKETVTVASPFLSPIPTINPTSSHSFLTPVMSTMASNEVPTIPHTETTNSHILTDESTYTYRPVYQHWFYKREVEGKIIWNPFTMVDSLNLDQAYLASDLSPDKVVATDGGRYDVNILRRERNSVYWNSTPNEVRRCSWFHKGSTNGRYVPYEENVATKLEEEFKIAHDTNTWNRKVELDSGETIIFHGPDVLVLFPQMQSPDAWGNSANQPRPRVVKRGMDEFHIEEGEPAKVDHLLFMVHGIGSVCDLKFRSVEEVVDEFRSISLQLVQSHYRSSCETGIANRVEVLPISWHEKLHSEDTGVDSKLKGITLESIPRLRDFTNDTILDVLFYTSPFYCQTIISSVANELNRIYDLFKLRNPSFEGGVSLGGHSLGSLILFDILCHQHPDTEPEKSPETEEPSQGQSESQGEEDVVSPLKPPPKQRRMSRRISYMMGAMGTGQPQLNYPHLNFNPKHFFALGSPIGMFVTVRGLDNLGEHFALPTCPAFYNIFHPYDPVAYRIESLVNPELAGVKPVLIPHHKGRKRMHLELKETMARVGADLKQRLVDSMKSTWNSFYQFTLFKSQTNAPNLEEEVDKVLEQQLQRQQSTSESSEEVEIEQTDLSLGILNQGRRIDYVLQEAPLEFFNEYIFALTSHVCYWESEDTMLLILKEIYNSMNISTDSQIPQQTMTIERPPSSPKTSRSIEQDFTNRQNLGVDPTMPMMTKSDLGPPPMTGFVKKS